MFNASKSSNLIIRRFYLPYIQDPVLLEYGSLGICYHAQFVIAQSRDKALSSSFLIPAGDN